MHWSHGSWLSGRSVAHGMRWSPRPTSNSSGGNLVPQHRRDEHLPHRAALAPALDRALAILARCMWKLGVVERLASMVHHHDDAGVQQSVGHRAMFMLSVPLAGAKPRPCIFSAQRKHGGNSLELGRGGGQWSRIGASWSASLVLHLHDVMSSTVPNPPIVAMLISGWRWRG